MKDILKKHGIKIGIAVLAALLVIIFSLSYLSGRKSFMQGALDAVMQPLEKGAARASDWLEGIYGYMYKYDKLKAENEALKERISELEEQAGSYSTAISENDRLRNLLGFKESNPELSFTSATVLSWSASNYSYSFTLSRGSSAGIAAGDCVVDEYGNLLGQVTELSSTSATVRLLLDPAFEAGAMVERSGVAGVIEGNFALMQSGMLRISYLPEGAELVTGDKIITSGKGGVLPRGLIVGTVHSVMPTESGLSVYATVVPDADFSSVSQVFVVTDYESAE